MRQCYSRERKALQLKSASLIKNDSFSPVYFPKDALGVIGSSTGSTEAIRKIFEKLLENFLPI